MSASPQTPIYAVKSRAKCIVHIAGTVAGITAVLFAGTAIWMATHESARSQAVAGAMAAVWLVGAPLWFWIEYFFIYRREGGGQPDSFEYFKQGQQVAASIWAGLAAALGGFAASDYSKPPSDHYECKVQIPSSAFPASAPVGNEVVVNPLSVAKLTCKRGAAFQETHSK